MSYHYHNSTNEFFDSTSYMPQMQMHHGYQDFYTADATSSMMTTATTSQPPLPLPQPTAVADGTLLQTDHINVSPYSNPWRHESWNTATSSSSAPQWNMTGMDHTHLSTGTGSLGDHLQIQMTSSSGAHAHVDTFSQCYMDTRAPTTSLIVTKKSTSSAFPQLPPRTRTVAKPFRCHTCGKAFSQAANLTAHKRIHTGEKPFMCPDCRRPFSQSSSLVTHRRTHTGERPYPCAQCEKAFTDSSTLTKHLRTHTGHKPYVCAICMMKFTQSGNLHRHMKTHK